MKIAIDFKYIKNEEGHSVLHQRLIDSVSINKDRALVVKPTFSVSEWEPVPHAECQVMADDQEPVNTDDDDVDKGVSFEIVDGEGVDFEIVDDDNSLQISTLISRYENFLKAYELQGAGPHNYSQKEIFKTVIRDLEKLLD